MSFVANLVRNANRGGALLSQYPLGNAPLLLADQRPWANNTPALDATGSGTRYDITSQAEAVALNWGNLQPGDVVNIYPLANDEHYRLITRMWGQGTAQDRIIINGVVQNGKAPVFNAINAVPAQHDIDEYNGGWTTYQQHMEGRAIFHMWKGENVGPGPYPQNEQPRFITIQNLDMRDAYEDYTYTSVSGATVNYNRAATGLWQSGTGSTDIIFQFNSVDGMGNGLFFNSNAELEVSERWVIRRNRFINGGTVGSNREHALYCAGHDVLYEGNFIGPNKVGVLGGALKDRSSKMVCRYNVIYSAERNLDFVDTDHFAYLDANGLFDEYDTAYCYGNILVNDHTRGTFAGRIVHWGGDNGISGPTRSNYRIGTLHFFNNTIINNVPYSTRDRVGVFQIDTDGYAPDQVGTIEARNNIFLNVGDTNLIWNDSAAGTLNLEGANVIDVNGADLYQDSDDRTSGTPSTTLNQNGTLIEQAITLRDPVNNDIFARDFSIDPSDTSGALTAGTALPASLSAYPVEQQYLPHYQLEARANTNKLGALD